MTAPHDKLRAALRETAGQIPPLPPPLNLGREPRSSWARPDARWRAWAAPLAAAALVLAVVGASLAIADSLKHQATPSPQGSSDSVPASYVALVSPAEPQSDLENMLGSSATTYGTAELRSTQTGAVLAAITPPKPYASFSGVTAAADHRTFVLSVQKPDRYPEPPFPAQRFYLLHIDPGATVSARMTLTALPAAFVPDGDAIRDMALSPDGTHLAAHIASGVGMAENLEVFDLATGAERAWNTKRSSIGPCTQCAQISGGMLWFGVDTDGLSWTADGRYVAFTWYQTVRLLDTRAAGSDIVDNSRTVATWTGGVGLDQWRGAVITPDGRTVLGIEQIPGMNFKGAIREQLVSWDVATGKQTVLNNLDARKLGNYEQILYTSDDGRVLVLSNQQPGAKAAIVRDGRAALIPWSPSIGAAAW